MRALAIKRFGGPEVLEMLDLRAPEPGPGEVVVRVEAAAVNPIDYKLRQGYLTWLDPAKFPIVLGYDLAGRVERLGPEVTGWEVGAPVYALNRRTIFQGGAYAEQVVVQAEHLGARPASLEPAAAAAVPLCGITALQALEVLAVKPEETLLIHGAAGGVGSFAVQLGRELGARVVSTARDVDHARVQELGAQAVVDYRDDLRQAVRRMAPDGVDAAIDIGGGEVLRQTAAVLRPGGRLISLVDVHGAKVLRDQGLDVNHFFVSPGPHLADCLARLSALFERGALRVHVGETFALADGARAHALAEAGKLKGKLVLDLAD